MVGEVVNDEVAAEDGGSVAVVVLAVLFVVYTHTLPPTRAIQTDGIG